MSSEDGTSGPLKLLVVLARAVDLHLRQRIVVYGNKTVVFD